MQQSLYVLALDPSFLAPVKIIISVAVLLTLKGGKTIQKNKIALLRIRVPAKSSMGLLTVSLSLALHLACALFVFLWFRFAASIITWYNHGLRFLWGYEGKTKHQ